MKLVRLVDAGQSGTTLGKFLEVLMREFPMYKLIYNLSRSEMQSNYGKFKPTTKFKAANWARAKASVLDQLEKVENVCERSGFTTAEAITDLRRRISENDPQILATLGTQISSIRNEICRNLNRLAYLEIPQCKVKLFIGSHPLKRLADENFKSSAYDIAEAGKCLALDRGTAAVMHLMRALETPLFLMAAKVRVNTKRRSDWGRILEKIERKLLPPTNVSKSMRNFLTPAAAQFRVFKDAWRNHAMHARQKYTEEEAAAVYVAVESFMKQLAKRLCE